MKFFYSKKKVEKDNTSPTAQSFLNNDPASNQSPASTVTSEASSPTVCSSNTQREAIEKNGPGISVSEVSFDKESQVSNGSEMQKSVAPQKIIDEDGEISYVYDISQLPPGSELADIVAENGGKYTYTQSEVRKLLRQYDKHILTFLCFLYFLSHLDRGNIGNAKVAGMTKDLNISSHEFSLVVIFFFVGYIAFQWGILLWKVIKPRLFAPWIIIGWGIVSTCCAAVQSWRELLVLRVILGSFEACFSPGVYYYFTFFYYRDEIAKRIGIFQSFSPISSAVSGVLAYAITKHAPSGIKPWRLLFIVEGIPSILGGIIAFFAIVNGPHYCKFLTPRQKQIAQLRTIEQAGSVNRGGTKIHMAEVKEALVDVKIWFTTLLYFCITLCQVPLPIFLPSIIEGLGYKDMNAQGMTAPPYLVAVIAIIVTCYFSDKYMQRAIPVVICMSIAVIGYILLAVAPQNGVRYFGLYLAVPGVYATLSIIMAWTGDNQGSDIKRGVGYIILHIFGMTGPIAGTFLFPSTDAPRYRKGIWVTTGFVVLTMAVSVAYRFYLAAENRKLDEKHGKVSKSDIRKCNAETQKEFRYVL